MDVRVALHLATVVGGVSPCSKSKRGVIIFHPQRENFYTAHNSPPAPFRCDGSDACRGSCGKVAVHAEARAILLARSLNLWDGWEMLHVKVVDGVAVASGPPSCVQCSGLILESGLRAMWLLHEDMQLVRYEPALFHELSLQNSALPVIR